MSSLGLDPTTTWEALISGQHGLGPIEDFDASGFDCRMAAPLTGLDSALLDIHPREARIMDKPAYMLLAAGRQAFAAAGLAQALLAPQDIGFFAAMGMVDYKVEDLLPAVVKSWDAHGNLDYSSFFAQGYREIYPLWPLSMLNNIGFCQVSVDLGIEGENVVLAPHADACLAAVAEATHTVAAQNARVALAGGVSEKLSPISLARASLFGILNCCEEPLEKACRPFGKDRKGTILGEGCGIVVVETRSHAERRGMPGLAVIQGYAAAYEKSTSGNCPSVKCITQSMRKALHKAALTPKDIDLIIAHGDGTEAGDRNEAEAIQRVYGGRFEEIPVFSSKAALGNLLAGAAALDLILGVQIMQHGRIPPLPGEYSPAKHIRFNLIRRGLDPFNPRHILINACSYEGQAASLIIASVD